MHLGTEWWSVRRRRSQIRFQAPPFGVLWIVSGCISTVYRGFSLLVTRLLPSIPLFSGAQAQSNCVTAQRTCSRLKIGVFWKVKHHRFPEERERERERESLLSRQPWFIDSVYFSIMASCGDSNDSLNGRLISKKERNWKLEWRVFLCCEFPYRHRHFQFPGAGRAQTAIMIVHSSRWYKSPSLRLFI